MRSATRLLAPILVVLALLPGAAALAATTPTYIKEDYATFQSQLNAGQVRSVTFNKKAHSLRITLADGKLYVASYPSQEYKTIRAQITAKGVPVTVLHVTKAGTTTTTTHHKLRYIAAGLLVLVVIVIALVLGFNRRRPPAEPAADAPAAGAAPPSAPTGE